MWLILSGVYILLFMVAFYGNYEEEEKQRDYKEYKEVVNGARPNIFQDKKKR